MTAVHLQTAVITVGRVQMSVQDRVRPAAISVPDRREHRALPGHLPSLACHRVETLARQLTPDYSPSAIVQRVALSACGTFPKYC